MSEPNSASSDPASPARPAKRRWWWWRVAFPLGLILAVVAVAAVKFLYQPQYEAASLLEISESMPYIAFPPTRTGNSAAYFRTQIEIIKSPWISGRTIAQPNIRDLPEIRKQPDPIEWLKQRVRVVSSGDSGIFEIKYSSADPESAALLVNEITRQYLTAQEEEEASRFRSILNALNEQLRSREQNVRALRQQVEQSQIATKKVSVDEPEQGLTELKAAGKNPLAELQSRLIDVRVERAMLAARIKAREEEVPAAETAEKKDALKATSSKQGDGESTTPSAPRDELRRLKVELRSCEIAEENLRSAYSSQLKKTLEERQQMSGESLNLKFKKEELAQAEAVLTRISDRLIAMQTEQSAPTRLIWHEPAKIPKEPVEAHLYRKMALAGAAALCFPCVAGFLALVLWNLGLLVGKLEPISLEAAGGGAASKPSAQNATSQAAEGDTVPDHCT